MVSSMAPWAFSPYAQNPENPKSKKHKTGKNNYQEVILIQNLMKSISYLRLRSSFWLLKEGGKGKENMMLNLKIFIIWGSNPRISILLSLLEWMDLVAIRCFLQKKAKVFCSIMFLFFYLFGSFRNQTRVARKIKHLWFCYVSFFG